jgi:hypothetical protein
VNVATLQPPAGAGNVVTVFVPGAAEIEAPPGAFIITIPDPPDPPPGKQGDQNSPPPPPPPPVLAVPATPALFGILDPNPDGPPPPNPPGLITPGDPLFP